MKKILVTGVAGFIGSSVANRLINLGYNVVGVDDLSMGKIDNIPNGTAFIKFDLADASNIKQIPKDIDIILHIAGQSSGEISFENPVSDLHKNTISLLNLIDFSIKNSVEKLVYASSMSVYGDVPDQPINENFIPKPISCYGVGKLASERYLEIFSNKLNSICLRMFNVYGPGQDMVNMKQGMLSIYISQAVKNQKVLIKGSMNRFRDFVHIDDVVEAWLRIVENETIINKIYNIASGKRTTVNEVIDNISNYFDNLIIEEIDGTPGDQKGIYADISLIKKDLDFSPKVFLEDGLRDFVLSSKSIHEK